MLCTKLLAVMLVAEPQQPVVTIREAPQTHVFSNEIKRKISGARQCYKKAYHLIDAKFSFQKQNCLLSRMSQPGPASRFLYISSTANKAVSESVAKSVGFSESVARETLAIKAICDEMSKYFVIVSPDEGRFMNDLVTR